MSGPSDVKYTTIPLASLVFGYGPVAPFVAAAIGVWTLTPPWPQMATSLALIWGGIILVFVAGVRRGYGFGAPKASTAREIATMLIYFALGGLSLVFTTYGQPDVALTLQVAGLLLVAFMDRRAAFSGDAPAYFATLRVPQMVIAAAGLMALLAHRLSGR
jgi:hypothetical protein